MNVLSLFDGTSCGRIALERAKHYVDNYYSSEIKSYAIEVADINYPQDRENRLGDILNIRRGGNYRRSILLWVEAPVRISREQIRRD